MIKFVNVLFMILIWRYTVNIASVCRIFLQILCRFFFVCFCCVHPCLLATLFCFILLRNIIYVLHRLFFVLFAIVPCLVLL
jgi:hypothetical protein